MTSKWPLFALLALSWSNARAEDITLTSGEWPPYLSQGLSHQGILSRIITESFALEGITVRYVFRPWPRALAEARSGHAHGSVVWSEGPKGSARNRDFHFSATVYEGKSVFFHRKDFAFTWQQLSDLSRYRIGGVASYDYLFENAPGVQIDRAASEELCLRKLLAGRFDVFPASEHVGRYILITQFAPADAARISIHATPYNTTRYHLILPRTLSSSKGTLARFNRGLARLKQSGRYDKYLADLEAGRY